MQEYQLYYIDHEDTLMYFKICLLVVHISMRLSNEVTNACRHKIFTIFISQHLILISNILYIHTYYSGVTDESYFGVT